MAWQLTFILWMVTRHADHYVNRIYALSDVIEGIGGYTLLIAMTITSFKFGRSRLTPKQWRVLHTVGIYWLWTYAFVTYWWYLFYSNQPLAINYVYYWMGFLAWGMRMAAWTRKRWQKADVEASDDAGAAAEPEVIGRKSDDEEDGEES